MEILVQTLSARFVTRHSIGSRSLQIRARACLAAGTDDLGEKMRCVKAIVVLDPGLEWAQAALTRVWYRAEGVLGSGDAQHR